MIYTTLVAATTLATAVSATVDLNNYSFEKFIKQHVGKHSWNEEEYGVRKERFRTELSRVIEHNKAGKSWKEGLNKFSVMSPSEKAFYHGHSKRAAAAHKATHEKPFDLAMKPVNQLPAAVDWRDHKPNVISSVKDQGHCGSW